jgi:hypothetical protein
LEDRWRGYPTIAMTYGILAILSTPPVCRCMRRFQGA